MAALALMGESADAPKWAALARAHHHRANTLLSPDGYYYESLEYWIFSIPWLVHFYDAWEHSTGESLWELGPARQWTRYLAHAILPDGQRVFDFGDIWEGALTRDGKGEEYARVYPGGTLQSNFNLMYRVAARFHDPEAQAVADRLAAFGHSNLEEYWTLLWRDASLTPAPMTPHSPLPALRRFGSRATGAVRGRRTPPRSRSRPARPRATASASLLASAPEWRLSSGHAHPDGGSFIIWAGGRYLTGDTGYAGQSLARNHNTITVGGAGQGDEGDHDVWRNASYATLDEDAHHPRDRCRTGARPSTPTSRASTRPAAGLTSFVRQFTFEAPGTFTVRDQVTTATPTAIQWYLHGDQPIERVQGGFRFGGPGGATLLVTPRSPGNLSSAVAPTVLMAPGAPGSITQGRQDQRGYHLTFERPAGSTTPIEVTLVVSPIKDLRK